MAEEALEAASSEGEELRKRVATLEADVRDNAKVKAQLVAAQVCNPCFHIVQCSCLEFDPACKM